MQETQLQSLVGGLKSYMLQNPHATTISNAPQLVSVVQLRAWHSLINYKTGKKNKGRKGACPVSTEKNAQPKSSELLYSADKTEDLSPRHSRLRAKSLQSLQPYGL